MPEAPFDEFSYGRHQGGWHPVCDETPADASPIPYVRASAGPSGGWYPLDNFLVQYAPLISPAFGGQPRAPHPPAADASDRIATTQFVRDNAGSGGGGIEEVPGTNGAYARVRSGGTATWLDFNTMRVAGLDSPQFAGAPTAPTPDSDDALTDRLATTFYVARDFLPRIGGQMSGPLITAPGTSLTSPGLAIGDNATGFLKSGAALILGVSGSMVSQWFADSIMVTVPLNMALQKVTNVADATADADALNRRTGDARYLRAGATDFLNTAGGSMTGPIHMIGTSGPAVDAPVVFGVRGAQIAWSESGNGLIVTKGQGNAPFDIVNNDGSNRRPIIDQALGDARYLQLVQGGAVTGPLTLWNNPTIDQDAVTKGYVDARSSPRAPLVVYDIPNNVTIEADGLWHDLASVPITLPPRSGLSMIMISVNCNLNGIDNVGCVAARLGIAQGLGSREQRIFAFGAGATSTGVAFNLFYDANSGAGNVPVQLRFIQVGGPPAPPPFTVLGGGSGVAARSQIAIVDLGPQN
jgi:hypothetical protein